MLRLVVNGMKGLAAGLVAYPIAERLEGRDIRSKRRLFAAEMALPFAQRRAHSWAAAVDMVRFAAANVPYYRDLFSNIRFDPENLARDPKYWMDIPHLTKDIIRAEGERLLRSDHANFKKFDAKTGGSTGPSAHIYYDQDGADWTSAVVRYARARVGNHHMRSELHFASKFPDAIPWKAKLREDFKCFAMNRYNIFFSTFEPDELEAIWQKIRSIRPHLVHSHPSTIYQLALHVEARHGGGKAFSIFESSGELLEKKQRETIARALRCMVIDRYGLAEAGVVAYQTDPDRSALDVFDPLCWPEVTPVEGGAELEDVPGASRGELMITTLKNRLMPLIRYRTGDLAVLSETANGFFIHELMGRVHDVIQIAGRQLPTHYVQDVLDRVGGIKEFQIVMRDGKPVFRIVPEDGADVEGIRGRLSGWWGDATGIEFIAPSELKLQGWRGKFRHFVPEAAV